MFETPPYDPLMTSFLAGRQGGMGYLPDAQYMTDPGYGAFRTMPYPMMQTPVRQQRSLFQDWLVANRGFGYIVDTYNPAMDQLRLQIMARRRTQDALSSAAGTAMDIGAGMGVSAVAMAALGGPLGFAAGMLLPSGVSSPMMDRVRQARMLQEVTLSNMVVGPDRSLAFGQGLSMASATRFDQGIRDMSNVDLSFKKEDYDKIVRLGMKNNLFDFTGNVEQYKRAVKILRDNTKTFREVMESMDFPELFENMKRIQAMGASTRQMSGIVNQESMFARMTGLSHTDMIRSYGQMGALIYTQTPGLTGYQGALQGMSNAADVALRQRLRLINEAEVSRAGGVSGMAQKFTEADAYANKRLQDFMLPYFASGDFNSIDADRVQEFLSGKISINELMQRSGDRVKSPSDFVTYQTKSAELMRKLGDQVGTTGMNLLRMKAASDTGAQMGLQGETGLAAGFMSLGYSEAQAAQLARSYSSPEYLRGLQDQLNNQVDRMNRNAYEERRHDRGIFQSMKLAGRKMVGNFVADTIGGLALRSAERKDYEENRAAGVLSVGEAYNTARDLSKSTEERMLESLTTSDLDAITGRSTSYYARLAGNAGAVQPDMLMADSITGADAMGLDKLAQRYKLADDILSASKLSTKDVLGGTNALRKLGLSTTDVIAAMEGMTSLDDISEKEILERLAQQIQLAHGGSREEAMAAARSAMSNAASRRAVLRAATKGAKGSKFATRLKDDMADVRFNANAASIDDLRKEGAALRGQIGEMTEQTLGLDNQADTSTLVALARKSDKALNLHHIEVLLQEYKEAADPKRRVKISEQIVETALKLGLTGDDARALMEDVSDTTLLEQVGKEANLTEEEIAELFEVAKRKSAGDTLSIKELRAMGSSAGDINKKMLRNALMGHTIDLDKTLRQSFSDAGIGREYSDVLSDPDRIKKLINSGSIKDEKTLGILKQALKMHKDGNYSYSGLVMGTTGLTSSNPVVSKFAEVDTRAGQEESVSAMKQGFENLSGVLSRLLSTMDRIDDKLKRDAATSSILLPGRSPAQ